MEVRARSEPGVLARRDRSADLSKRAAQAGTQAPPVDAIHPIEAMVAQGLIEASNAVLDIVRQRGRPRIHPDRRAYKAAHERKRRAEKKAK